ncbi:MAG: formyl transferase [Planctomycetota bacterium]
MTRVVFMTGNARRHRYAARSLACAVELVGVISEAKQPVVDGTDQLSSEDLQTIRSHLAERDEVEATMLGESSTFPDVPVLAVQHGEANAPTTAEWLAAHSPDFVILFGTSIIKADLLDRWPNRVVNVHLGLSPYYRGSGTNFWPLVNGEPELVGATIHLATAKVDAGPILCQVRPDVFPGDRAHHLGTRTIVAAFRAVPPVLEDYHRGALVPKAQRPGGHLYRRRDFDATAVRRLWSQLHEHMIEAYLARREERLAKHPIIE